MPAALKLLAASLAILAIAWIAEQAFVPHVLPVAFSDDPQPLWSVETAFLLRAIENITAAVAAITLLIGAAHCVARLAHGAARH
jgi:hypothetical protein